MPCTSNYPDNDSVGLRKEADIATRAACDMRTILRRHKLLHELTEEAQKWVKKHDKEDAARIAEEIKKGERKKARARALKKLTLEDRRVLNL